MSLQIHIHRYLPLLRSFTLILLIASGCGGKELVEKEEEKAAPTAREKGEKALEEGRPRQALAHFHEAFQEKASLRTLHSIHAAFQEADLSNNVFPDSSLSDEKIRRYERAMALGDSLAGLKEYEKGPNTSRKTFEHYCEALRIRVSEPAIKAVYSSYDELLQDAEDVLVDLALTHLGEKPRDPYFDIDKGGFRGSRSSRDKTGKLLKKREPEKGFTIGERVLNFPTLYYPDRNGAASIPGKKKEGSHRSSKREKIEERFRAIADSSFFEEEMDRYFLENEGLRALTKDPDKVYVAGFGLGISYDEPEPHGDKRVPEESNIHFSVQKGWKGVLFEHAKNSRKEPGEVHRPKGHYDVGGSHDRESFDRAWVLTDTSEGKRGEPSVDTIGEVIPNGIVHQFEIFFDHSDGNFSSRYLNSFLMGKERIDYHYDKEGSDFRHFMVYPHSSSYSEAPDEHPFNEMSGRWGVRVNLSTRFFLGSAGEADKWGHSSENPTVRVDMNCWSIGPISGAHPLSEFIRGHRKGGLALYRTQACEKEIDYGALEDLESEDMERLLIQGAVHYDQEEERFDVQVEKLGIIGADRIKGHFIGYRSLYWVDASQPTR